MGEMVEFESNGKKAQGYLATPEGSGPGVIVIQEWWGLAGHIKEVADRLAAGGFVALAPDMYHGKETKEPDEAEKLMMDLDTERAAKDLSGAVGFLKSHETVEPKKVGSIGFCMGGALSLWLASLAPIDAAVVYYGGPFKVQPDYSKVKGAVLGHFAEHDEWASPEYAESLFKDLKAAGVDAEYHVYEGATHAFFNDTSTAENPKRVGEHDPASAETSWERTMAFLKKNLS
jgi:carboxymethylenebutenolidase